MWWAGGLQGLGRLHSELAVAMLLSDVILRGLEEQCGREFRRGLNQPPARTGAVGIASPARSLQGLSSRHATVRCDTAGP